MMGPGDTDWESTYIKHRSCRDILSKTVDKKNLEQWLTSKHMLSKTVTGEMSTNPRQGIKMQWSLVVANIWRSCNPCTLVAGMSKALYWNKCRILNKQHTPAIPPSGRYNREFETCPLPRCVPSCCVCALELSLQITNKTKHPSPQIDQL